MSDGSEVSIEIATATPQEKSLPPRSMIRSRTTARRLRSVLFNSR